MITPVPNHSIRLPPEPLDPAVGEDCKSTCCALGSGLPIGASLVLIALGIYIGIQTWGAAFVVLGIILLIGYLVYGPQAFIEAGDKKPANPPGAITPVYNRHLPDPKMIDRSPQAVEVTLDKLKVENRVLEMPEKRDFFTNSKDALPWSIDGKKPSSAEVTQRVKTIFRNEGPHYEAALAKLGDYNDTVPLELIVALQDNNGVNAFHETADAVLTLPKHVEPGQPFVYTIQGEKIVLREYNPGPENDPMTMPIVGTYSVSRKVSVFPPNGNDVPLNIEWIFNHLPDGA